MDFDWQRLLKKKDPEPPPGDRSLGTPMVEPSGQEQRPADAGVTGQTHASTRGVAGMVWRATGTSGMTGQSLTKGGLPQLLYSEEHKCAFCRGTGQTQRVHRCPVCRGAAKMTFTPPVVRCAFCCGDGHAPRRSNATCTACRGSGVISVKPPIQVCTKCRGHGKQMGHPVYCGSCRGSGVVTVSESEHPIKRGARPGIERMAAPKIHVAAPGLAVGDTERCGHPGGPPNQEQGLRRETAPKAHSA